MARVEISETVSRNTVLTSGGSPVASVLQAGAGASVQVNIRGGGAATIYAAATGGTTVANPQSTDALGRIQGWLEEGSYDLVVDGDTANPQRFEAVAGASMVSVESTRVKKDALPYAVLDASLFSGANIDAALTQAKADMGSTLGRLILPRGALEFLNPPAFNETHGLVLEGAGGRTTGAAAATKLVYKGTAARAIDARSSSGFGIRDIQLLADQAAFTGKLVDLSHSIVQDGALAGIEHCYIGGVGSANGFIPVSFANAICHAIRSTKIENCKGVRGRDVSGDYSNRITFDDVTFVSMVEAPIQGAGQAWAAKSCTFEQLANGLAGAFAHGGMASSGVSFSDACWFGDSIAKSVTGVAATDIFTCNGHGLHVGDAITFAQLTGGAGISTSIPYYVISVTTNTFQVSDTLGGASINFTTDVTVGFVRGVWIAWTGSGFEMDGNFAASGGLVVWAGPSSTGIDIGGNQFDNLRIAVSLGANVARARVFPNEYSGVVVPIEAADAVVPQSIFDYPPGSTTQALSLGQLMQLNSTIADGETALLVRRNVGGAQTIQRVSMGAADSGGAGFKSLRVPN